MPKSKDPKKNVSGKRASLVNVLEKNEGIKEKVKESASKLTSVNKVLKQKKVPVKARKQAFDQNEDVEQKVSKAAKELSQVNVQLAEEISDRIVVETELAITKTDLAETRNDLSKAQVIAEEAQQIARQDALTGLANRISFGEVLDHGLSQAKRHGWGLAVLFIDIDEFKSINDIYGHDIGDKVLLMVAERLKASVRGEDMVSRWGGDEFACLLFEVKQEADVIRIAEKMKTEIAEACKFNGATFSIRASIGIAIYPAHGETAEILFKKADTAMYKAKKTKKGVVLHRKPPERKAV